MAGNNNFTGWTTQAFTTKSTGIKNTNGNNYSISLLPNPNNGAFTVYGLLDGFGSNTPVHISVVNTVGQALYSSDATLVNGAFTKNMELPGNIAAGTYMVNVSCGNKHSAARFSVVK